MSWRPHLTARFERKCAQRRAAAPTTGEALTPYEKLLRAAERGQFEALVRKARPADPPAMVTPQQREADLRASGRWPDSKQRSKPAPPKPVPQPAPIADPPPRELTPNEQYLAEHVSWGASRGYRREPPRECLTDYDPLAEERE
jgi:hypothetical protein